jgi:asparagine synthase (glutamine-hydrolysing)
MMFADAPVGALCSGGVDSSLLMAMAARDHDNLAIFHADVMGPGSEYEAAKLLAKHLKLDLKKVDVHDQDFIDLLPDVMVHYEHPYYRHHHSVPFFMVSRLVREHNVKGVLTGEGSDECFLGYDFIARRPLRKQLQRAAALANRIRSRFAPSDTATMRHAADMLGQFEVSLEKQQFRQAYVKAMGRAPDNNITTLDLLAYHLRTLLHRNDSMGMASSIEARFPFLSEDLVKTAINLPYDKKIRLSLNVWEKEHPFLRDKWCLRKVADRYLPKALSQRKKWPFTATAYRRMKIPQAYFKGSFVADYFELTQPELDYLLENAEQKLKIKLLKLNVWGEVCLGNAPLEATRRKLQAHLSFAS